MYRKAKIVNTSFNSDNNSSESDVIYLPDFESAYKDIKLLKKNLIDLDSSDDVIKDNNWNNILKTVFNLSIIFKRYMKEHDLEGLNETNVTGGESFQPKLTKKPIMRKYLTEENSNFNIDSINDYSKKQFIEKRLNSYNEIEKALNIIIELLKKRKKSDELEYMNNPSYQILTPTDTVLEYLKDVITLIK